jgi:hypothetical protein
MGACRMNKSAEMSAELWRYWCEIKEARDAVRRRRRPSNFAVLDGEFFVIQEFSGWPRLKARAASDKAWCEQISQPRATRGATV